MSEPQTIEEKKTYRITGVEIFSVGTWNGKKHDIGALNDLVTAYSALKPGWIPGIKLGHDKNQTVARQSGLPSVGWVEKIYTRGDRLYADFDGVPEKVYQLIKKKAYRKVSCEIFYNVSVGDQKYSHVLAAVALLGNELPGVSNLNDILAQYEHLATGEVFAILEKQDTFKQYSRTFELNQTEDVPMSKTESELKLEQELADSKKNFETQQTKLVELEKSQKEFEALKESVEKEKIEAAIALKAEKRKSFVADLKTKKLVTKATEPMILDLLDADKQEFEIDSKKLNREELLEKVLTLTAEAGKVNFEESSLAEFATKKGKDGADADDDEKIKEYMKKNECSYAVAYKAVMKKMSKK